MDSTKYKYLILLYRCKIINILKELLNTYYIYICIVHIIQKYNKSKSLYIYYTAYTFMCICIIWVNKTINTKTNKIIHFPLRLLIFEITR